MTKQKEETGTREERMAAMHLRDKMVDKYKTLQERASRIRAEQSAKGYKKHTNHVDEWMLVQWEMEASLLEHAADLLESQLIDNLFVY